MYNFPLKLSFKKIALAPQITVTDSSGQQLMYVRQKLMKLKEAIQVFSDNTRSQELYTIGADRVIDFSAQYHFRDTAGNHLGSVKRQGMRSIFKARYDIFEGNTPVLHIEEDNGFVKVMDALFGEIPIVGIFSGFFFNPTYSVKRNDGTVVVSIKKKPALFESEFTIEEVVDIKDASEIRTILAIIMMVLMERSRG